MKHANYFRMAVLVCVVFALFSGTAVAQNETPSSHVSCVVAPARFQGARGEAEFLTATGSPNGQRYITVSLQETADPGLNPVIDLIDHIQRVDGTFSTGVLLHTGHGGASRCILMESFTDANDAMAQAAAQTRLNNYNAAGWITAGVNREIQIHQMDPGWWSIIMFDRAITNRGAGLAADQPLVYIATCHGDLMGPAYVNRGARVALGPTGSVSRGTNRSYVQTFFKRMNGEEGQVRRAVAQARLALPQLVATGNENTTLAPSVLTMVAPYPIAVGNSVTVTLDTRCDIGITPDIVGTGCAIGNEAWLNATTLQGTCTAGSTVGDVYTLTLEWDNTYSSNNTARLDGNTEPSGVNARGPAHDDFERVYGSPNHYVILIDRTGSMGGARFQTALQWAHDDLDNHMFVGGATPEVAVMHFATDSPGDVTVVLNFTHLKGDIETAIDNNIPVPDGGWTPLAKAMCAAADLLAGAATPYSRHLFVYTDGEHNRDYFDPNSPVCGPCGDPAGWQLNCDPDDCPPPAASCTNHQCCFVDQLITNGTNNVRYLGEPVPLHRVLADREGQEPAMVGGIRPSAPTDAAVEVASPTGDPSDYALLKYIAEESGGFFTFECDSPPVITCPNSLTLHWRLGSAVYAKATATNGDPADFTFAILSVVPPMFKGVTINPANGDITIDPECVDIGNSPHVVTVEVTDGFCSDQCTFEITVNNQAPTIACPNETVWQCCYGPLNLGDVANGDPDGDPTTVMIETVLKNGFSIAVPAGMTIDPDGKNFIWDPGCHLNIEGEYEITLRVDDGCWQRTCTFVVTMYGMYEIGMDCPEVLPGYNATVVVSMDFDHFPIGGFDLLISYDAGGGINFLSAKALGDLADYWEYFTYRYSQQDNCGGGCPSGYIRLVGIYDMPNGSHPAGINLEGDFVELTFSTTEDRSFLNQCFWLDYAWFDCGDNTLSSITGDTLFIAADSLTGGPLHEYVDGGWCLDPDKGVVPIPCIILRRGCICLIPPEDERGDINLNGIANEIADAVIFANYFIYGPGVLGYPDDPYYENRVLATDINDDGIVLTVADLVYLVRIITGDANPYPESGEGDYKAASFAGEASVNYTLDDRLVVSVSSTVDLGAAAFVFRHTGFDLGTPVVSAGIPQMTVGSSDREGELRVLIYSMEGNSIDAGVHELFAVPYAGRGNLELIEGQVSDALGNMLTVNSTKVTPPSAFELSQNYPNPFNAGTVIRFALPEAANWRLRIYNVTGQLIKEFGGQSAAGYVSVGWDAAKAGSGIYFYKLTAGNFTNTKKMVLMK